MGPGRGKGEGGRGGERGGRKRGGKTGRDRIGTNRDEEEGEGEGEAGMHWKRGGQPPPPPGRQIYAQQLFSRRQVPSSMAFVTDSNHP